MFARRENVSRLVRFSESQPLENAEAQFILAGEKTLQRSGEHNLIRFFEEFGT